MYQAPRDPFEDFDVLSELIREAEALPPKQTNMPPSSDLPAAQPSVTPTAGAAPVVFNPELLEDNVPEEAEELPPEEAERILDTVDLFVEPTPGAQNEG